MPTSLQTLETLQRQLAGSMRLVKVTCDLAVQLELDEILATVTSSICEALDCDRASLFLCDDERDDLYIRVATELEVDEIRVPRNVGITGWVVEHRRLTNVPDPSADPRWNPNIDLQTGFQSRSILAAPVISARDGRLVGVLQALNKSGGAFDEFDEQLIQAFASHAATALERAQLLDEARDAQALQLSVQMGRGIQSGFLPRSLPEIAGYEVAAWWQPAEHVSGDYYDIVPLPDGRVGLAVADVSGHGVGASLIMASARAMLHVVARTSSDPERILGLLSETIFPDLNQERFITFLMAALDPSRHEITFVNAGHAPAFVLHARTRTFRSLTSTGLPIGFTTEPPRAHADRIPLDPGDVLLLATDGTIELTDASGDMFGRAQLEALVAANSDLSAAELLQRIRTAILQFHPNREPPDDVTMLIVKRAVG